MKDSKFTTSRPLNQSVKPSWMNCYPAQSKDQFSKELILLMRTLPSYHVESAHWTHICHWRVRITYPKAQGRSKRQQIQRSSWKVWGWQWVHPAQHSWIGKCSQLQAEPAGTLRLFNIKKLLSQQQSSKIASLSFLNTSTEFIAPLVQKSDRSYEDPAPNTQQQPPTHAHAPATPDYKEPKPSTPRQGSPSPEMLSTAANTASTLPSCVCSPVLSLSASWPPHRAANGKKIPPNFLPQHLLMVEESSPLIIPHQQCPASPAASSGSAATQTRGTWVSHLWPHKATINTTLTAAAGMCARRKHCHHNFYDIFWSLREDHCMSLKQL